MSGPRPLPATLVEPSAQFCVTKISLNPATQYDNDTQLSDGNGDPELNALPEWRQSRTGLIVSSLY